MLPDVVYPLGKDAIEIEHPLRNAHHVAPLGHVGSHCGHNAHWGESGGRIPLGLAPSGAIFLSGTRWAWGKLRSIAPTLGVRLALSELLPCLKVYPPRKCS